MHGSYTEKTGQALLSAVAQACWLSGFMAGDVGRHSLAQRYYIQALDLAMRAGDRIYAGYVLSQMCRMTVQIGQSAVTDQERARHARQTVALARAGQTLTHTKAATPLLAAQLSVAEGRGAALLGDAHATRRAIRNAEYHYDHARTGEEPPVLGHYTDASLAADIGRCLRDIGEPDRAVDLIDQAMRTVEPWQVRSRCFFQTDLAAAHLGNRDLEQAATIGRDAVHTAAQVKSTLTLDRLRGLQRAARPLRASSRHLRVLDDQITGLLARHGDQPSPS